MLLSLAEYKTDDAIWISTHLAPSKTRQSLVEFPGVLLPSFQPTLQALQKMSRKPSLPFAEIVAPDWQTSAAVIKPPAYATKRGFSFNLDVLAGVPLTLKPGQSFEYAKLDGGSTLDEAQQFAVVQALSTGLALIPFHQSSRCLMDLLLIWEGWSNSTTTCRPFLRSTPIREKRTL